MMKQLDLRKQYLSNPKRLAANFLFSIFRDDKAKAASYVAKYERAKKKQQHASEKQGQGEVNVEQFLPNMELDIDGQGIMDFATIMLNFRVNQMLNEYCDTGLLPADGRLTMCIALALAFLLPSGGGVDLPAV